jgi:outer membrane lipoprotein-sorting protein
MRRKLTLVVLALLCTLPLMAQEMTAQQVIDKNLAAHGGVDKLKAVKTAKASGTTMVGPGGSIEAPITMYMQNPGSMRMELTVQGMTLVQAYDAPSKTGWFIMPFQGKKDAEPMSADDLKDVQEQADDGIAGPFVDWQGKGYKVALLGKEKVEGSDAYKLQLTRKSGDLETYYIDADSFLEVREESKRTVRGSEVEGVTNYGDYKEVDGLVMPFSIESGPKDKPEQRQKININKYEFNVPLDAKMFAMPAPAPAAPADKKEPSQTTPQAPKPDDKPKSDVPKN